MPTRGIITGQRVDREKVQRAREFRREMTAAERTLWLRLRTNRLRGLHFRRQQIIDGFIVDFYCHAAGLVVEIDGDVHQSQAEYDRERDRALAELGLRVMRFTNDEVREDPDRVLEQIAVAAGDLTP